MSRIKKTPARPLSYLTGVIWSPNKDTATNDGPGIVEAEFDAVGDAILLSTVTLEENNIDPYKGKDVGRVLNTFKDNGALKVRVLLDPNQDSTVCAAIQRGEYTALALNYTSNSGFTNLTNFQVSICAANMNPEAKIELVIFRGKQVFPQLETTS